MTPFDLLAGLYADASHGCLMCAFLLIWFPFVTLLLGYALLDLMGVTRLMTRLYRLAFPPCNGVTKRMGLLGVLRGLRYRLWMTTVARPSRAFAGGWCVEHPDTLIAKVTYSLPWV